MLKNACSSVGTLRALYFSNYNHPQNLKIYFMMLYLMMLYQRLNMMINRLSLSQKLEGKEMLPKVEYDDRLVIFEPEEVGRQRDAYEGVGQ